MKTGNRDLLVLSKSEELSENEFEQEVECLNVLLYHVENFENFCMVNEVLDVNRHKIITNHRRIKKLIFQQNARPFIFISNKN